MKITDNMVAVAVEGEQEEEPEEELYEIKQRPEVMLEPRMWSDVEGQTVEVLPDRKMLAK